ncbi:adenosine deaminase [Erwinia sp. OLTSP20]|uniref:DNA-3-methyladenine glycosylase 2 family protein n=1 Tax=unclassified Erwinia TaxID=2622719 RepID=UPI000C190385|nr:MULTISPECIES: AlkA N-terminal domain-containing protein [unclassified Erwinia]PIJ48746.1 adenosine deaminase [Erwinia sp. OAMSP11]PIJ69371.1 adenosine deaminase [Erwinia sp. OLSSP12]PIJ79204.1 adenosine deaminase [Erwinia sp. OLCASP19]PIJ80731.1 adenosine deaminase [Erwinia sp. OLMTSP26]PIJ82881.1 adenosine deaminase [Erwinia sp. OLMDSP33]
MIERHIAYQALTSRDTRFDGVFFVGVTSTGIYCRPVCPVKPPREENCLFFASASAAEKASFRPCLRCRPELAPGNAPLDHAHRVAGRVIQCIDESLSNGHTSLESVARHFAISLRQLRRIVQSELGVSPLELKQTRRLLLAKQLLTETRLPVTEIAFASGFASLRLFNDVFRTRYRMPPSHLRRLAAQDKTSPLNNETSTLLLSYRPPYDWQAMLEFLRARMIQGVEYVDSDSYARTVQIGSHHGWLHVSHNQAKNALNVRFSHSLSPVLPAMLQRLRNLFDLSAQPQAIYAHLVQDPLLQASLEKNPGLRVPGAFDGFEMVVRAILGQQVTVKAATTLGCRFADAFGNPCQTPLPQLNRLSPQAERLCTASVDDIARLGIVSARTKSILALAAACQHGGLRLEAGAPPDQLMAQLRALPGIGPWTASYIAMRALRWPDAFPAEDIAIRNNLGNVSSKQAGELSQRWRPWRSYAVLHIWKNLSQVPKKRTK